MIGDLGEGQARELVAVHGAQVCRHLIALTLEHAKENRAGYLLACAGSGTRIPYRRASEWLEMREQAAEEWDAACAFDERNREDTLAQNAEVDADELYVWRGHEPLRTADLEAVAAREKRIYGTQLPMFGCESGYCGV